MNLTAKLITKSGNEVQATVFEKQLEEGAIYGEHYAEHFRPTMEVLKVIIERLEELQNGRNESGLTVTGR